MFSLKCAVVQRFANGARGGVRRPPVSKAVTYCQKNSLTLDRHEDNTGWGFAQLIATRDFGAPKRYKGKGHYVRKKNAFRKKGDPRNVRELLPAPPVLNAVPKEELARQNTILDQEFAQEMKNRIDAQTESVRFGFDGVIMSDRVRRLFELTNGSQQEVVKSQKQKGMELFQMREGDTGSSGVQIIALTTRIQQLQTHMTTHRKDNSTKRGLQALFVRRRKLLDYLERTNFVSYRNVVKTLGLSR